MKLRYIFPYIPVLGWVYIGMADKIYDRFGEGDDFEYTYGNFLNYCAALFLNAALSGYWLFLLIG